MKTVKKILLVSLGLVATVALLIVGLQSFYTLTPSVLSPEAVQLNERAALLPSVTDNGYRLNGMFAPKDVDPLRYGRCLLDANDAHRAEVQTSAKKMPNPDDKAASDAYWKKFSDRAAAWVVGCLEGGTRVVMPKELADLRIKPGMDPAQWQALAAVAIDPLIVARAEAVWAGDARRLGVAPDAPIGPFQYLLQLERWRTARAVQAWHSGERMAAIAAWSRSINDWVKTADDTLIDAMISTASLSQVLIGVQAAMARSERVDDAAADAAIAALAPLEMMPKAIGDTMVVEWQSTSDLVKSMPALPSNFLPPSSETPGLLARTLDSAGRLTYEVDDTLNFMARDRHQAELAVIAAAQGKPAPALQLQKLTPFCGGRGAWEYLCVPFIRNPSGRILALVAVPSYVEYGVRVADLRNLAAVTRLSIEVRRRALSGDAVASFIANPPIGMRDVFTDKSFAYDAAAKALSVELRTRSSILGDKGIYSLQL